MTQQITGLPKIITDFDLQIKEQAMLYNFLVPKSPVILQMQVYLQGYFQPEQNKEITSTFIHVPNY
jgi:hypothetical protein